jgi:hypothetical protein
MIEDLRASLRVETEFNGFEDGREERCHYRGKIVEREWL